MRIDIEGCSRCGKNHYGLTVEPLLNPFDDYKYFTMCPNTEQPISIQMVFGDT